MDGCNIEKCPLKALYEPSVENDIGAFEKEMKLYKAVDMATKLRYDVLRLYLKLESKEKRIDELELCCKELKASTKAGSDSGTVEKGSVEISRTAWKDICETIRKKRSIPELTYNTFIEPLYIKAIKGNDIYLGHEVSDNDIVFDYIRKKNYDESLEKELFRRYNVDCNIIFMRGLSCGSKNRKKRYKKN